MYLCMKGKITFQIKQKRTPSKSPTRANGWTQKKECLSKGIHANG